MKRPDAYRNALGRRADGHLSRGRLHWGLDGLRHRRAALGSVSPASGTSAYIQHVVIVVQENRSFDDFFATFPGADGATQGMMKTPSGDKYIQLQSAPLDSLSLGHQHNRSCMSTITERWTVSMTYRYRSGKASREPAGTYAYRYVDPADIPEYWAIANQYVLGDHMFTTQSSDSFTAHQDLIAAGTPVGDAGR